MGWLSKLLGDISGSAPTEFIFAPSLRIRGALLDEGQLHPDECYLELYVESLRLEHARSFATTFNGVVYSFATLAREGEENAQFAAVSKPEHLSKLDSENFDPVIIVSKQMMGAVPWRGGTFRLELGLFSVKSGNLLTPVLDYVTKISASAGISFVGSVKPFLPLITEGMDMIAGQRGETAVEVALDTDFVLTTPMIAGVIAAPKGSIDLSQLAVDPDDHKLLLSGSPLQRGYVVFSIRQTKRKADFGEIPELKERYSALQVAIRSNKRKDAEEALVAFRLATIASPDLIPTDARTLVARAEQKMRDAFPGGGVSALRHRERELEPLSAIGLYS